MDAKRVRGGLLAAGAAFVAVLVVALLLFFVSGDEADLSYRSVDFDAQLQSNGDIRFTEHLDYQLKRRENDDGDTKPWKQLYLTFNCATRSDEHHRHLRDERVHRRAIHADRTAVAERCIRQ